MFEWGGYNADGATWGFNTERPTFGDDPIHQLMIDNNVSAFFHGHDHQYAYEVRDGIVYQSLPRPSTGIGFNFYSESDPYTERVIGNSGHLRVEVTPYQATVSYIRSNISEISHTYNIAPGPGSETCADVAVDSGWNMVSVPVKAPDMSLLSLFQDITPPAYSYNGNYLPVSATDILQNGNGYWMLFDNPQSYEICGQVVTSAEISVNTGWNMIGPFDSAVAVDSITSIPTGILVPPAYAYSGTYNVTDTLTPGDSYWIFANQDGIINLGSNAGRNAIVRTQP
jgi:hypothetical protein